MSKCPRRNAAQSQFLTSQRMVGAYFKTTSSDITSQPLPSTLPTDFVPQNSSSSRGIAFHRAGGQELHPRSETCERAGGGAVHDQAILQGDWRRVGRTRVFSPAKTRRRVAPGSIEAS